MRVVPGFALNTPSPSSFSLINTKTKPTVGALLPTAVSQSVHRPAFVNMRQVGSSASGFLGQRLPGIRQNTQKASSRAPSLSLSMAANADDIASEDVFQIKNSDQSLERSSNLPDTMQLNDVQESVSSSRPDTVSTHGIQCAPANNLAPKLVMQLRLPQPAYLSTSDSAPKSLYLSSFHPLKQGAVKEISDFGKLIAEAKQNAQVPELSGVDSEIKMPWPNTVHEAPKDVFQKDRQLIIADGFQMIGKEDGGLYRYDPETQKTSQLLEPKKGWFYHDAKFVDIDGDGTKELITARSKSPWFYRKAQSELVVAKPPMDVEQGEGAKQVDNYWQEQVIGTGPDYFFEVHDIDGDGDAEIVATEYGGRQLSMFKKQQPAEGEGEPTWQKSVLVPESAGLGELFDLRIGDFNQDGEPEILFTNHVGDDRAGLYVLAKNPEREGDWKMHTIVDGIETRREGHWELSPGSVEVFQPRAGIDEKPHFVMSGDGAGEAWVLAPLSQDPNNWHYSKTTFVDEKGSMIGKIHAEDIDNDGNVELCVPIYYGNDKKDRVDVFSYEPQQPIDVDTKPKSKPKNLVDQIIDKSIDLGIEFARPTLEKLMGAEVDKVRLAEDLRQLIPSHSPWVTPLQSAVEKTLGVEFDLDQLSHELSDTVVNPQRWLDAIGLSDLQPYFAGDAQPVSFTAKTAAAMKAAAGAMGDDSVTQELAGKQLMFVMSALVKAMPNFIKEMGVVSRAPWITDRMKHLVTEKNIDQVVMLAAGLDARAYNLDELKDVSFYEIDFPALVDAKTQEFDRINAARQARGEAPLEPKAKQLTRIGADLTDPAWQQSLKDAGFDPKKPTLFVAEGLYYYFDSEQALQFSKQIRDMSAPDSHLLMDCLNTASTEQNLASQLAGKDAVFKSGFDHPEVWFKSVGYDDVTVLQPGEPGADFGVDHDKAESAGFHRAFFGTYDRYAHLQPRDELPEDGQSVKRFYFVEAQLNRKEDASAL